MVGLDEQARQAVASRASPIPVFMQRKTTDRRKRFPAADCPDRFACARRRLEATGASRYAGQLVGATVSLCNSAECGHGRPAAYEPAPRQNRCGRASLWWWVQWSCVADDSAPPRMAASRLARARSLLIQIAQLSTHEPTELGKLLRRCLGEHIHERGRNSGGTEAHDTLDDIP